MWTIEQDKAILVYPCPPPLLHTHPLLARVDLASMPHPPVYLGRVQQQ